MTNYKSRQEFFDDLDVFLMKMEYARDVTGRAKNAAQAKALLEAYIEQRQQDIFGKQ